MNVKFPKIKFTIKISNNEYKEVEGVVMSTSDNGDRSVLYKDENGLPKRITIKAE